MSEEKEFIDTILEITNQMITGRDVSTQLPPETFTINTYKGGRGSGHNGRGDVVSLVGHPLLPVKDGDSVVCVPVKIGLYYVIGVI